MNNTFEAIYHKEDIPEYDCNPLIAALPPILALDDVETALQYYPACRDSERKFPIHKRFHFIDRLFHFFQPWDKHFELERKISRAIRQGYVSRNPMGPSYQSTINELYEAIKNHDSDFKGIDLAPVSASGFSIIGFSGIGKTRTIEKILSLYKQIISHKEFEGKPLHSYQITWMKLDCPPDGSIKALCSDFFLEHDRLLGDNVYKKFAAGHNTTVDLMIPRMAQQAWDDNLGLLVIDEIQHLSLAKSGGSEKMLNFFVTLVNRIGIPVILIGTSKALPILQGSFRQARRSSGQQGGLIWKNMHNDNVWKLFLNGLWKYQWTAEKVPLTPEMEDLFFYISQGIEDVAVKLFAMAQMVAISSGKEKISPAMVKIAAREGLKLIEPMLDALRTGNKKLLLQYEDLLPIDIENFRQYQENKMIDSLRDKNITKIPEEKQPQRKIIKIDKKKDQDKDDLRVIVENGKKEKKSAYEALKSTGFIKNAFEEFIKAG